MPRPEGISKLARKRIIKGGENIVFETPMLVPSYSSKGFPDLKHIIENTEPYVCGPILVSAYDYIYEHLPEEIVFPSLIFFDSGGYEAQKEADLSEYFDALNAEYSDKRGWTEKQFEKAVSEFNPLAPVIHISYDHPSRRISIEEQIKAAQEFGGKGAPLCRELLLKPTTKDKKYLDMDLVVANARNFSPFSILGVTEKELGASLLDRMTNIARLRLGLQAVSLDHIPIHVFGSLDTLSTLLYFVMGADIFDGLTWLRYGYDEGRTVYRHEFAALKFSASKLTQNADEECLQRNYNYLQDMELQMNRFITTGEFDAFKYNSDKIEELSIDAWGRLGMGNGR